MPFDRFTGQWKPSVDLWDEYAGLQSASLLTGPSLNSLTEQWAPLQSATPGGQALTEYWEERTPDEDWTRMMVDLPADPRYRRGFESMRDRLEGRYLLAQPYMGVGRRPAVGVVGEEGYRAAMEAEVDPDTSFSRFLQDIGSGPAYRAASTKALRERAKLAANLAMQPIGASEEWTGDPTQEYMWGTFGPESENAFANQVQVAQMLGRQRAGGGQFRGRLGSAIDRSIRASALARQARGAPEGSFLDWYLGQTAPAG